MKKDVFPAGIAEFTEYIKNAYQKASVNLSVYGIPSGKFTLLTPLYNDYIAKEAIAANPDTATKGARAARKEARGKLEKAWRQFLNESIRYNMSVGTADKEVFGISLRDNTRTAALSPTNTGMVSVKRLGAFEYEAIVTDEGTSKRKLPAHAGGSYIYMAISAPGILPEGLDAYRKLSFSSNPRHELHFSPSELGQQANVYVRYANRHGKEGPIGPVGTFLIH